jgi:uncharacterized protein YdbL (DUF1318 family)
MATLKPLFSGFAALALLTGGSVVMTAASGSIAHAQSSAKATVDAAKARGEIGEQVDGYLGIVTGKSPSEAVRNAMLEINIARKAVYTQAADGSGQPASVFAQLTGEKQIKKSAQGTYVKDATGVWKKK